MMAEGSAVTLGVARRGSSCDSPPRARRGQRLIEQGFDPRQVKRAVRYGRAKDLGASR